MDPLGGSYYVEALTDRLEREAEALFEQIDDDRRRGARARAGLVPAEDRRVGGTPAVGDRAASPRDRRRQRVRHGRAGAHDPAAARSARTTTSEQRERLAKIRAERDQRARASSGSTRSARGGRDGRERLIPHILDCARAYCTLYEIRARSMERVRRVSGAGVLLRSDERRTRERSRRRRLVGVVLRRALPARVRADLRPRARSPRGRAADRDARTPVRRARARRAVRPGTSRAPARRGRLRRRRSRLLAGPARSARARAARDRRCATRAATCDSSPRAGPDGSTRW